jgi:hypothetical protein
MQATVYKRVHPSLQTRRTEEYIFNYTTTAACDLKQKLSVNIDLIFDDVTIVFK